MNSNICVKSLFDNDLCTSELFILIIGGCIWQLRLDLDLVKNQK